MRSRRSDRRLPGDWPAALRRIVRAAEHECPRGHAEALSALASLALEKVPSRGIFDPAIRGEHDLFTAIEDVATRHLALDEARSSWRSTLESAELSFERRSDLESAALQVQTSSDTAYFYAGLAFGLASVTLYREG